MEHQTNTKVCKHEIIHGGYCHECLSETKQAETKKAIENGYFANIPDRFKNAKLSDFDNKYSLKDSSYFISGSCGTGKTHLAVALVKDYCLRMSMSNGVMFYNFQEMAIALKCSFSQNTGTMNDIVTNCKKMYLTILDDICTARPTPTEVDALYLILNYKYENIIPVIYTSNLSMEEICLVYGDRIASRLSACTKIKLTGGDKRISEPQTTIPQPKNYKDKYDKYDNQNGTRYVIY